MSTACVQALLQNAAWAFSVIPLSSFRLDFSSFSLHDVALIEIVRQLALRSYSNLKSEFSWNTPPWLRMSDDFGQERCLPPHCHCHWVHMYSYYWGHFIIIRMRSCKKMRMRIWAIASASDRVPGRHKPWTNQHCHVAHAVGPKLGFTLKFEQKVTPEIGFAVRDFWFLYELICEIKKLTLCETLMVFWTSTKWYEDGRDETDWHEEARLSWSRCFWLTWQKCQPFRVCDEKRSWPCPFKVGEGRFKWKGRWPRIV